MFQTPRLLIARGVRGDGKRIILRRVNGHGLLRKRFVDIACGTRRLLELEDLDTHGLASRANQVRVRPRRTETTERLFACLLNVGALLEARREKNRSTLRLIRLSLSRFVAHARVVR